MSARIEELETRTLLSSTAVGVDELKLIADAKASLAVFQAAVSTYHTQANTLAADVKALPRTKTNNALLLKASKDQLTVVGVINADGKRLVALDESAVMKAVGDAVADQANPTAANNARLAKGIQSAETIAAKPVAALEADLTSSGKTINSDLDALVAANPTATQLNTDVATAKADETAAASQITTQVNLIQSDLATLVTDLQA